MFPHMIRGWYMDILLHRGRTGWRCRGSGGLGPGFILRLVSRSLRISDLDGDGTRGAWIGITTGSSIITRHISRGARHFSIAERTTEGVLGLRGRENTEGRWAVGKPIADMRRREKGREKGRERLAGLTTADYREDFRRGGRVVLADSTAEDSVEAASTAVVDAGNKACGIRALYERCG
jgi:hypothetical protein